MFPDDLDRKQRKRRYLKLVKRFPPEREPEAFAHLRALYEGIAPPKPPVDLRPDPEVVRASDAAFELLQRGLFPNLAALLTDHGEAVREEQPAVWEAAVRAVLMARVAAFPPEQLQAIVDRVDGRPTSELEQQIEELALLGLSIRALAADPAVPDAVFEGLARYGPAPDDPDAAWDALVGIGNAAGETERADLLWAHVEREHPAVTVALHALGRRVIASLPALPGTGPIDSYVVGRLDPGRTLAPLSSLLALSANLLLLIPVVVLGLVLFGVSGLGFFFVLFSFIAWRQAVVHRIPRLVHDLLRRPREQMAAGARRRIENWCVEERVLPWEAGSVLLAASPDGEVGPHHALLALGRDVGATARIVARLAADGVDREGLIARRGGIVPSSRPAAEEGP